MDKTFKWMIIALVTLIAALVGYGAMTMQDRRSATDKISDAVRVLPEGAAKAEQQLESRTPGQKLGDAIKENTQPLDSH